MDNFAVIKNLHNNLVGKFRISYFPLCMILGVQIRRRTELL